MGTILAFLISVASALLQFVATLNIGITSWLSIYQPKCPKSLLK